MQEFGLKYEYVEYVSNFVGIFSPTPKFPVVFLYEDKDRMIENFKVKSKFRFVWENGQAEKTNTWRR